MSSISNLNSDELMKFRQIQLRLLDAVDKICKKHGLKYWLDFGTLLGAVRSGEFIPWDDDVDISMPFDDYKKFLEIAKSELPDDIFLQTVETDMFYNQSLAKLRDTKSILVEYSETGDEPYHHGVYIDIFVYRFYPKLPSLLLKSLTYIIMHSRYRAYTVSKNKYISLFIYGICKFIWKIIFFLPKDKIGPAPEDNGYYSFFPTNYIFPLNSIPFEGKNYPVPRNFHDYLSWIYGDYMTLPPTEKRVGHAKKIIPDLIN